MEMPIFGLTTTYEKETRISKLGFWPILSALLFSFFVFFFQSFFMSILVKLLYIYIYIYIYIYEPDRFGPCQLGLGARQCATVRVSELELRLGAKS